MPVGALFVEARSEGHCRVTLIVPMIPLGSVDVNVNVALRMSVVKVPSNSVRLTNSSNLTSELFTLPNNASLTDAPTGTQGRLVEISSVELVTVNVNEPVRSRAASRPEPSHRSQRSHGRPKAISPVNSASHLPFGGS